MGMYTELTLNFSLKKELPTNVLYALEVMTSNNWDYNFNLLPKHDLFKTERFQMVLSADSFNDSRIESHTKFKNYDSEIELFIDWIRPFVDQDKGSLIGFSLYEEDYEPTEYRM